MKVGDKVSGELFDRGIVLAFGTAEELAGGRYDASGAIVEGLNEWLNEDEPCVAVETSNGPAVYVLSKVWVADEKDSVDEPFVSPEYAIMFASPLSIPATKALIDAHGGFIVDFDEEDDGHQYTVSFPRSGDEVHDATAFLSQLFGEPTDPSDYDNRFDDSDLSPAGPVS